MKKFFFQLIGQVYCLDFFKFAFVIICVFTSQSKTNGQAKPRFILNPGGPVSKVHSLEFSPDSSKLFVAGSDKSLQIWSLAELGIGRTLRPILSQTIHWPIARGNRGAINAIAISPDGNRVAIGGSSAYSVGDIFVFDTASGTLENVLKRHKTLIPINGLAFSDSGGKLASVSADGQVIVWEIPQWTGTEIRPPKRVKLKKAALEFLSGNNLAIPVLTSKNRWQIKIYDATNPSKLPRTLSQIHNAAVVAIERDRKSNRWASADKLGNVFLWDNLNLHSSLATDGAFALSFGDASNLLISTEQKKTANLHLWNLSQKNRYSKSLIHSSEYSMEIAASLNGRFAATFDAASNKILFFNLDDPKKNSREPIRCGGILKKPTYVAFSQNGTYEVGFGTVENRDFKFRPKPTISHVFDPVLMKTRRLRFDDRWCRSSHNNEGWDVSLSDERSLLKLSKNGIDMGEIRLDPNMQGSLSTYCWLENQHGSVFGIAVGTFDQCGIFLYGLTGDGKCRLLRHLRDHHGRITSLSVSSDCRFLASSSADGTIKFWSIEEVGSLASKTRISWGAEFVARENDVEVNYVAKNGVLAGRQIAKGDRIVSMIYESKDRKAKRTNRPREIVKVIETLPLWKQCLLSVQRKGQIKPRRVQMVPAWEPLATLFVTQNNEWAYWSPQGIYNASVNGDELFGWIVNQNRNTLPKYFRADEFRADLEKPEVMKKLLVRGNLVDALKESQIRSDESSNLFSKAAEKLPEISILKPKHNQQFKNGQALEVVAKLKLPVNQEHADYQLNCYINGIKSSRPVHRTNGGVDVYKWTTGPANKYNRVKVVARSKSARDKFVFDDVFVRGAPNSSQRRLHIFGMAADAYKGDLELDMPVKDFQDLLTNLRSNSSELYKVETVKLLKNSEITPQKVDQTISFLRRRLAGSGKEDLLLVFVAGHGLAFEEEYYFVPPRSGLESLRGAKIKEIGISWRLMRRLASIPCRKVFLLDTCYSGNVVLAESDNSSHWKKSIRPLRRSESLVICASDVGENSFESSEFSNSVFMHSILNAMSGKADGLSFYAKTRGEQDGEIDLSELASYVISRVPALTGDLQNPTCTSSELGFVPISRPKTKR